MSTLTVERRVAGESGTVGIPPSAAGATEARAQLAADASDNVGQCPPETGPYSVALCCTFETRSEEASLSRTPAVTRSQS
jgi:hypothetical protein